MLRLDTSLDQYFTVGPVSDHLVGLFDNTSATDILDLGAGGGALSAAAVRRWSDVSVTTVDIDHRVAAFLSETLQAAPSARHVHHVADALDVDLPEVMRGRAFELAVCNPPYSKIAWREGFTRILSEAGLEELHAVPKEALTSDVLFLAQILRLAKPGAEIGLIVPDGLVSGIRSRPIREALMRRTDIRRVVELPRGSFRGTEARAHVMVLRNSAPTGLPIVIGSLERPEGGSAVAIGSKQGAERLDWAHYSGKSGRGCTTLDQLGAQVVRGRLSSVEIKSIRDAVFHTSAFPVQQPYVVSLSTEAITDKQLIVAEKGDILIARVDRRLESKVCMVQEGEAVLSDCILRIRLQEESRRAVFEFLTSPAGREALYRTARGVGARMLSKTALLAMEIDLNGE